MTLDLLSDATTRSGVAIWSYCLMPNHVHIIAMPSDKDGLRRTFRYVHRHYTGYVNARLRVTGHRVDVAQALERVGSFAAVPGEAFDEAMTYASLRKAESVGRPVGSKEWLADMEVRTCLTLAPAKRGPRPKEVGGGN
jgi:putative transposase